MKVGFDVSEMTSQALFIGMKEAVWSKTAKILSFKSQSLVAILLFF